MARMPTTKSAFSEQRNGANHFPPLCSENALSPSAPLTQIRFIVLTPEGKPAKGDLARFEITHTSGKAVVSGKDLSKPISVSVDGKRKKVIPCEVRLSR
ncbi:MAG: hypothetical protein JXM70_13545 [Pirellulales bacterium]|nr:hypothetical protein [Pirellulales bacterium]